jgi:hypothetical protein
LISILPISRNRAERELVTVLEGPEEGAGGDKKEDVDGEEGVEEDALLVSDLLITGGSLALFGFCLVRFIIDLNEVLF